MLSCEVLRKLKKDLTTLSKPSNLPFDCIYSLGSGAELAIDFQELEDSNHFRLSVNSGSDSEEHVIEGHNKALAVLVGLAWLKMAAFLEHKAIEPCCSMKHEGADEILALYQSVREFQTSSQLPFVSSVKCSDGAYDIYSVKEENSRMSIELLTNFIYGKSVKTIAEVQYEAIVQERSFELLERLLGEWIRPESVKSMRVIMEDFVRQSGGRSQ